jgi:hypothetical protein
MDEDHYEIQTDAPITGLLHVTKRCRIPFAVYDKALVRGLFAVEQEMERQDIDIHQCFAAVGLAFQIV